MQNRKRRTEITNSKILNLFAVTKKNMHIHDTGRYRYVQNWTVGSYYVQIQMNHANQMQQCN